jgi:hypothetical protein
MVEAVRGDGRTGLAGFVSELKLRISDKASGTGAAFDLAKVGVPGLWRRIFEVQYCNYVGMRVLLAPEWREENR